MTTIFSTTWTSDADLSVYGEVDIATSPDLQVAFSSAADGALTVDLAGLTFIDASGLTAFVSAAAHHDLLIINPTRRVVRTFAVGNVQHLLDRAA